MTFWGKVDFQIIITSWYTQIYDIFNSFVNFLNIENCFGHFWSDWWNGYKRPTSCSYTAWPKIKLSNNLQLLLYLVLPLLLVQNIHPFFLRNFSWKSSKKKFEIFETKIILIHCASIQWMNSRIGMRYWMKIGFGYVQTLSRHPAYVFTKISCHNFF